MTPNTGGPASEKTLLDEFAGQALVGYIAHAGVSGNFNNHATECYDLASAMLAEKARREGESDSGIRTAQSDDGAAVEFVLADSSTGKRMAKLEALNRELAGALEALLARDQRNTCQHEETHRGGVLWEICDQCGAQWADDEGGKPAWSDPPEWIAAEAALAKAKEAT